MPADPKTCKHPKEACGTVFKHIVDEQTKQLVFEAWLFCTLCLTPIRALTEADLKSWTGQKTGLSSQEQQ